MDQKTALQLMKSGKNVFLTGQAGSGKTYVLNQYIHRLRDNEVTVAITASTGIAATHIGWTTIHSWSGIGIREFLSDDDVDDIAHKPRVVSKIRDAKVLIIDEISMLSAQWIDNVERVIKAVKYDYRPWGGMQVIFCGDFFQLPPVSRHDDDPKRFAFAAQAWNQCDLCFCYLDTQYRQDDDGFMRILDALRKGEVSEEMLFALEERTNATLATETYVRLYTHNADVDRINEQALAELPGEPRTFSATTKGKKKMVEGMLRGMITPEELTLKIWAHVLFTKNNPWAGYRNGTTGEVVGFADDTGFPIVRTSEQEIVVTPEDWMVVDNEAILASVSQVPLKLARAMTVHKSQGMTLDAAEVDLSRSFAHGQAYVALSRVKSLEGLRLLWLNKQGLAAHPLVMRGDAYFRVQSAETAQKYSQLNDEQWNDLHEQFVLLVGGSYKTPEELDELVRPEKEIQQKKQKTKTLDETKQLIEQGKTIDEIVTIRGFTRNTAIGHLGKIRTHYPEVEMDYLRPDTWLLTRVAQCAQTVASDPDNFTDKGDLRLAPIYHGLGKEISYEDLRWCMVFVDVSGKT